MVKILFISYRLKQNNVSKDIIGDSFQYVFHVLNPNPNMEELELHSGKVIGVTKSEVKVRFEDQEEWYFTYDEYRLGRELMDRIVLSGETIQFTGMKSSRRNKKRKVNDSVGDCDPTGVEEEEEEEEEEGGVVDPTMRKAVDAMKEASNNKLVSYQKSDIYEDCIQFNVSLDNNNIGLFIVFPSKEARDNAIKSYIGATVHCFKPVFIQEHLIYQFPVEAIVAIQRFSTDANTLLKELMINFDEFVQYAISREGRGFFLQAYDEVSRKYKFEDNTYYYYKIDEFDKEMTFSAVLRSSQIFGYR